MKILNTAVVLAAFLMLSGQVWAGQGGKPGAHGLSGKDFGQATSGLARSAPGAVKDHKDMQSGDGPGNNGKPGAHGLSGKDFGQATSGLAKSAPGAVKDHKDMQSGD